MKSQENIKLAEIAAFYIQCGSHGNINRINYLLLESTILTICVETGHNLNNVSPAVINGYSIRIKVF